jgi:hypothetical protein
MCYCDETEDKGSHHHRPPDECFRHQPCCRRCGSPCGITLIAVVEEKEEEEQEGGEGEQRLAMVGFLLEHNCLYKMMMVVVVLLRRRCIPVLCVRV